MGDSSTQGNDVLQTYYYQIRSEDGRNYGKGPDYDLFTQFTVDLFEPITCMDNESILVSLASCQFPFTYYTTNDTNNQIPCFTTLGPQTGGPVVLTIPPGNYNVNQLITEIQTQFDAAFGTGVYAFDTTLLITYSPITNKLTFTTDPATSAATATFSFQSAPVANPMILQLGNNPPPLDLSDFVFGNTAGAAGISLASINVLPLIENIYLRSDLTTDSSVMSSTAASTTGSKVGVLQKIPAHAPANCWIYYQWQKTSKSSWVKKKSIQSISFRFTNFHDVLIDTNLVHFYFTLKFDIVRRPAFLMPMSERRLEAFDAGAPMNVPTGIVGGQAGVFSSYYNTDIYRELRGVPEGYHVYMMRRNRDEEEGQIPPQEDETAP